MQHCSLLASWSFGVTGSGGNVILSSEPETVADLYHPCPGDAGLEHYTVLDAGGEFRSTSAAVDRLGTRTGAKACKQHSSG